MAEEREIVATHVQVGPYVVGWVFKVELTENTNAISQEKRNTQFASKDFRADLSLVL